MLISLHQSRFLGAVMLLTHVSALTVVYWIEGSIWSRLLLAAIVVTSLFHVFQHFVLRRARNAITAIELENDGNMKLVFRNGASSRVSRLRSTFTSPLITLITATADHSRCAQKIVIPFDAVEPQLFRKFRVKVKQGRIA